MQVSGARPEPGLDTGAWLTLGDVTPSSRATSGFPRSNQIRLLRSNHHFSRPLRRLLRGGWTPTPGPFGLRVDEHMQPIRTPGQTLYVGVARPKPGPGRRAGLTLRDVIPGRMATAGVPRSKTVRLLGSNQQTSRPLGRLLWGGGNPWLGPFRA